MKKISCKLTPFRISVIPFSKCLLVNTVSTSFHRKIKILISKFAYYIDIHTCTYLKDSQKNHYITVSIKWAIQLNRAVVNDS